MLRSLLLRFRSCHDILGISPCASRQELKHRYHQLARSLHPDAADGQVDSSKFAELKDAYEACLKTSFAQAASRPYSRSESPRSVRNVAPLHLRTSFPGAFRVRPTGSGSFQGQPWKWRIKGPLTLSAQRKVRSFTLRR